MEDEDRPSSDGSVFGMAKSPLVNLLSYDEISLVKGEANFFLYRLDDPLIWCKGPSVILIVQQRNAFVGFSASKKRDASLDLVHQRNCCGRLPFSHALPWALGQQQPWWSIRVGVQKLFDLPGVFFGEMRVKLRCRTNGCNATNTASNALRGRHA